MLAAVEADLVVLLELCADLGDITPFALLVEAAGRVLVAEGRVPEGVAVEVLVEVDGRFGGTEVGVPPSVVLLVLLS